MFKDGSLKKEHVLDLFSIQLAFLKIVPVQSCSHFVLGHNLPKEEEIIQKVKGVDYQLLEFHFYIFLNEDVIIKIYHPSQSKYIM